MRFQSVLLLAICASTALAQRVSFPNFTGPSSAAVRTQLTNAVCDSLECVAAPKVVTAKKPDWKKAKRENVAYFVTGKTVKKGKALSLELQVLNKPGAAKAKKTFPLDKSGTLSAANLQSAMDLLDTIIGREEPAPAPQPKEPTPEVVAPKVTPAAQVTTPEEPREIEKPVEAPPKKEARKAKFLKIDVGADLVTRTFQYAQLTTGNLRPYTLPPVGQPAIGVQLFPFALMRDDLLSGLGLEAGVAFAPWIQSRVGTGTDGYATSIFRLDAGIRWDLRFIESFALVISPYLGIRSQSFTVGANSAGARIDGLPNQAYFGLRAGLGIEVPIVPQWVVLFGRFGVIPVFGSGEIISAAYFPNGSTFGLEANAGVGVNVLPFMQIRASFEFQRYGLAFKTEPTDRFAAAGASDTWLGGNLSLRFAF